jgi:beta-lactamase regulating signal transducer with metallopeptidase domain
VAWWLFQNVVVTALLAGVVALVCRTTRLGPVARHALWVIVLVKFIVPPVLVWPWAAPDPLGVAAIGAHQASALVVTPSANDPIAAAAVATVGPVDLAAATASPMGSVAPTAADIAVRAWPWLLAMWIAGSLWMLTIETARLVRVARAVNRSRPGSAEISARVGRLSQHLRLRDIPVVTIEGQSSPAIWCVGRPRLLWPASLSAGVTDACIDGLLVHELAHVQRRDHLVGWVDLVAGVIWWWNPLFWYVRSALREQAELACDAWVISALPNGRRAYAESLLVLSSAAVQGRSPAVAAVIGIRANNRRVLERRLVMIMQGRASLRLSVAGLVALAVMALASLPAWATASQQTAPQPATVTQTAPVPTTAVAQSAPAQAPTPAAPVSPQGARPVAAPSPATAAQPAPVHAPTAVLVTPAHPVMVAPSRAVTVTPHAVPSQVAVAHPAVAPQSPVMYPTDRPWVETAQMRTVVLPRVPDLPADGQELLKKFEADRDVIQQEADKKIEARRADFVKALQVLQDQYTKAGKLDEAVAIRDYIKAGAGAGPGTGWTIRRK